MEGQGKDRTNRCSHLWAPRFLLSAPAGFTEASSEETGGQALPARCPAEGPSLPPGASSVALIQIL